MKKSLMVVFTVLCIVAFSGILTADETKDAKAEADKKIRAIGAKQSKQIHQSKQAERAKQGQAATTGRRTGAQGGPANRAEMTKQRAKMMEQQFAKDQQSHKSFIAKLTAIRKIAKSENASKTVAELDKLIAESNSKFEAKVKHQKERAQMYSEMMNRSSMSRPRGQGTDRPRRGAEAGKKDAKVKESK